MHFSHLRLLFRPMIALGFVLNSFPHFSHINKYFLCEKGVVSKGDFVLDLLQYLAFCGYK